MEKTGLLQYLAKKSESYNPVLCALTEPFSSPGYHTTLKSGQVHLTRTSCTYAKTLLGSGEVTNRLRAFDVLDGVLRLQDSDPISPTYGIWPWFYEEPLTQMSPPDWNWADFCGKELVMITHLHADVLPDELYTRIKQAIFHACMSIFRRNVSTSYTNICIMGSFVLLFAGEQYNWTQFIEYGERRLERLHAFTCANQNFAEYNSPTYTVVAIEDLTRIYDLINKPSVRKMAGDLLDIAWRTVTEHFHVPTRQWTGPQARAYAQFSSNRLFALLECATDGKVKLLKEDEYRDSFNWGSWLDMRLHCPEKYITMLLNPETRDAGCQYHVFNENLNPLAIPLSASSYLSPLFTLGSFVRMDGWNQRRSLLGYWGDVECPRMIRCRILHDFYDFSSGMLSIAQSGGNALAALSFVTDGGDTHINLDMVKNATIRAKDLRLRIEFANLCTAPIADGDSIRITDGGIDILIHLLGGEFDGRPLTMTLSETAEPPVGYGTLKEGASCYYVDIVFYHGEAIDIDLSHTSSAFAVFALSMGENPAISGCTLSHTDGEIDAAAQVGREWLRVLSPARPVRRREIESVQKAFVRGLDMDECKATR